MLHKKVGSGTLSNNVYGQVNIDGFNDRSNLIEFAKEFEIDVEKYFPISVGFSISENHEAVLIDVVEDIANYAELKEHIAANPGPLVVKRIETVATFGDYLRMCKRFSMVLAVDPELLGQEIEISDEPVDVLPEGVFQYDSSNSII
ncbi:MAG: hypothetical protein KAH18_09090 [Psychromonas sp.]|nr:hypothetical protein [Psychromonas sp.]